MRSGSYNFLEMENVIVEFKISLSRSSSIPDKCISEFK